ncbi:hypothetical protein [Microvirga subterranea]|uniref:GLTT repeat-containing protein n=1 Tax=Microvirga subterranea TaxID=186651 RepID=A0A370HJJ2_9HYPH|nr:hypothetical protein [Microvirga subterranea]RDI58766.1 GLTT repeat-containing protein [Microvirga subterranea]
MKVRIHTAVLATAIGLFSLSPASAFWDESRPPPNGLNGLSTNGLSANGLSANGLSANGLSTNGLGTNGLSANGRSETGYSVGDATIRAVVLTDGARAELH